MTHETSESNAEKQPASDAKSTSNELAAPVETAEDPRDGALAPRPDRWKRLHTLSGSIALAAFLALHLFTNASALGGYALYDAVAGAIARFRLLPLFEVVFIVLPLGFHAGYGLHLLRRGFAPEEESSSASDRERYGERRLWVLQRVSAAFVLVFVLGHLWELRLQRLVFGLPADALYTVLTAHLSSTWLGVPWIALGYLLGLLAVCFHLANGLFAATASWKVGVDAAGSSTGRKRVRIVTVGLGLILFVVGTATVIGLATGTRLLPGADGDSGPQAPCGPSGSPAKPPLKLPTAPSH
jgi:succinate dehydrogenase / fumarate reductase, cytochrome b subunit